jgi:hypothetical protein
MGKKLTEVAVQRVHRPKTGQTFLWDSKVAGFGVRILPSGSRTFWFQYRPRGRGSSRMVRIGAFPAISVADAWPKADPISASSSAATSSTSSRRCRAYAAGFTG